MAKSIDSRSCVDRVFQRQTHLIRMADQTTNTIVFDAVGTLIRPVERISQVYHRHAVSFGCRLDVAEVKRRFKSARQRLFTNDPHQVCTDESEKLLWSQLVKLVFHELPDPEPLFQQLWQYYAMPDHWVTFPEVDRVLEDLWQADAEIVIASNFDTRLLGICGRLPPLDRIQHIFCSGSVGFRKPDLRFYKSIETSLNDRSPGKQRQLVMVGDDFEKDVLAARAAGWTAIHINRPTNDLTATSLE